MIKTLSFHVRGTASLLMHHSQLANPANKHTRALKAVTSKRKKTDEDHVEMARIEFMGGLYLNTAGAPQLPAHLIEATITSGAKATKQGKVAKAALYVTNVEPLIFQGPKTAEELWADERFVDQQMVRVQAGRVNRTRARFDSWECKFDVNYDDEQVNPQEVTDFVRTAGERCGFGDNRPKFGRFEIVNEQSARAAA